MATPIPSDWRIRFWLAAGLIGWLTCPAAPMPARAAEPASRPAAGAVQSATSERDLVPADVDAAPATNPNANPYAPRRRLRIAGLTDQPDAWFTTAEGRAIVDHIVSWQNANGGWWKDYDLRSSRPAAVPDRANSGPPGDDDGVWHRVSTFDNDATYSEMHVLARACRVLKDPAYRDAFDRGLKYVFEAQYPNGGWPQRYPLQENYGRRITFNDDAMTGVMVLLKDITDGLPDFAFVGDADRQRCAGAFDRGVECILNCQIKVGGKLTAWCQQHDERTLAPAGGRAYELPSITGGESANIALLLMRIEKPDPRVRAAVEAAAAWYDVTKITGKRWTRVSGPQYTGGHDRALVDDPSAPPLWARFYDLETGKPFFSSRDGIKRGSVEEISYERRNGYGWYGTWGNKLAEALPGWERRVGAAAATQSGHEAD